MSPLLKAARPILLDAAGVIVFAALTAAKVELMIAVAAGLTVATVQVAWDLVRRRPVGALQWVSLALVAVSAAASLLTHDARFVMAKPTVVYAMVGAVMLKRGWIDRYVPARVLARTGAMMVRYGYVWAGLMFVTAIANLVTAIAFPAQWPAFLAVFPLGSKAVLFGVQYLDIRRAMRAPASSLMVA